MKPFNRTSMESKPVSGQFGGLNYVLLIEPVWNRNIIEMVCDWAGAHLLIEPVWNRNV